MTIHYPTPSASLPAAAFSWTDANNNLIDFSTGYTFRMTIGQPPNRAVITKTTGFTGYAPVVGSPNLVVSWAPSELSSLTPGNWHFQITATQTGGGQRILTGTLRIDEAVLQ
jgi:hypothetical protein